MLRKELPPGMARWWQICKWVFRRSCVGHGPLEKKDYALPVDAGKEVQHLFRNV